MSDSERDNIFDSVKKLQSDLNGQRSSVAKQRSAEAEKRSAEAIRQTIETDIKGIKEMAKYYNLCIKTPETNDKNEIEAVKNAAKHIIQTCKKYNTDYKAILRKELGDEQKVKDLLKFYGIE